MLKQLVQKNNATGAKVKVIRVLNKGGANLHRDYTPVTSWGYYYYLHLKKE